MSYDQVAYSDKRPFTDSHEYTDDPPGDGMDRNGNGHGNGIYNDYTTEIKPKTYNPNMSFLCFSCQNTKKIKFVIAGSAIVVIGSIVLIIISAIAHKNQEKETEKTASGIAKTTGLFAYGPDANGVLEIDASNHNSYMPFVNRLEDKIHIYNTIRQVNAPDTFLPCNENETFIMPPKEEQACMQTLQTFGDRCQHGDLYGAQELQPCVLLVLSLDIGEIPVPFNLTTTNNSDARAAINGRDSDHYVGVSCDGATEADRDLLKLRRLEGGASEDMLDGGPFLYHPANGFPTYFYAQKHRGVNYISPAVMVQMQHIPANHRVKVRCTAWAENFNDGRPQDSSTFTTQFEVLLTKSSGLYRNQQ